MDYPKNKNYNGHIYAKDDVQAVLNTQEIGYIKTPVSVLYFPDNVSLHQVKQSLKTMNVLVNELIRKEKHESKLQNDSN
jgi:hypothetical protein